MKYLRQLCLWFLDKNPLTELEMAELTVKSFDLYTIDENKEEERDLFKRLGEVEGFTQYLRDTMNRDIRRYFNASSPMEQLSARGAFNRTNYLKGLLNRKEAEKKITKKLKVSKIPNVSRHL